MHIFIFLLAAFCYKNADDQKQEDIRRQGRRLMKELKESSQYREANNYKNLKGESKINIFIETMAEASQHDKYNNEQIRKLGRDYSKMINNIDKRLKSKINE